MSFHRDCFIEAANRPTSGVDKFQPEAVASGTSSQCAELTAFAMHSLHQFVRARATRRALSQRWRPDVQLECSGQDREALDKAARIRTCDYQNSIFLDAKATHSLEKRIQVLRDAQLRVSHVAELRLPLGLGNADVLHSHQLKLTN